MLIRKVGDADIAFKFAKSVKLGPGETITVWSSGENKKHEPPHTIVMKNQKWVTGDVMDTVLQNKDGEVEILLLVDCNSLPHNIRTKRFMMNFIISGYRSHDS